MKTIRIFNWKAAIAKIVALGAFWSSCGFDSCVRAPRERGIRYGEHDHFKVSEDYGGGVGKSPLSNRF